MSVRFWCFFYGVGSCILLVVVVVKNALLGCCFLLISWRIMLRVITLSCRWTLGVGIDIVRVGGRGVVGWRFGGVVRRRCGVVVSNFDVRVNNVFGPDE